VDLARTAKSLRSDVLLGGWLHRHTCFLAAKAVRGERRRKEREKEALEMSVLENDTENLLTQAAPILDEAIDQLDADDRAAVLLRFFERQNFRSVGQAMGTTEDGARMRVNRALEKLHGLMKQKGIILPAAALGSLLSAEAVNTAPPGLVAAIMGLAVTHGSNAIVSGGLIQKIVGLVGGVKAASLLAAGLLGLIFLGGHFALRFWTQGNQVGQSNAFVTDTNNRGSVPGVSNRQRAKTTLPSPDTLDALKAELRALLQRPQESRQYPPPALAAVLRKFEAQWLEAVPVLLDRLDEPDFETQRWALSGLWHMLMRNGLDDSDARVRAQARSLAQAKLSAIFRSEDEPVILRRYAAQALIPNSLGAARLSTPAGTLVMRVEPLDTNTLSDIITVLLSDSRDAEGFRFEVISPMLERQVVAFPKEGRAVRDALAPLLEDGDFNKRLLAAFALATIPGARPAEVKAVLLQALEREGTREGRFAYRAADALGMLGAEAADTVPALLKYAKATKQIPNGATEHALEAVCRIDPSFRQQYPDIDAKLKSEEAVTRSASTMVRPHRNFANLGAALADPEMGTNALKTLVDQLVTAEDPSRMRQELSAGLLTLWENAPADQREAIERALAEIGAVPGDKEQAKMPAPSMQELLLAARVLLLDFKTTNDLRLNDLLSDWDAYYRSHPTETDVTSARYQELSHTIEQVDAEFQRAWTKAVMKNLPNLDRIIVKLQADQ
jgi:hypothetical protein